ncbi:MAG: class II aldolase/adducin family protein [Actinobacteria bacterium]|nr:class II aldolase/adducin family protein [Actinomycetota bacterium]
MKNQIDKYTRKLIQDRSAVPDSIRFFAMDDVLIASQDDEWKPIFEAVLAELNIMGLLLAKPPLPFADYLVTRAPKSESRIYPRDSEVKTFLHDIPFIRKENSGEGLVKSIIALLRERKGLIIEGVGFVTGGTVTLEQAYIAYSSIFHATFIKYLHDVLEDGFLEPNEEEAFLDFRENWLTAPGIEALVFREGLPVDRIEVISEISTVGRYMVECGFVDSFFGNISLFHDGVVYISQTGASLDELDGLIDPVPMDGSSTCGITASSELAVHRKIYEMTDYKTILHGHPKFSVIISMLCDKRKHCDIVDCGKQCPEIRMFHDIPIVSGEIGAGGIAKKVPPVVKDFGRALVFGHGPFCTGLYDFQEPLSDLVRIEILCREGYFKMLEEKLARCKG